MKKLITAILMVMAAVTAYAFPFDKYSLNRSDLPQEAQEFLSTYFPKGKVSMIKVDKHLFKKTDYDVKLVNGTKIEFNNKGKWTSVDCTTRQVDKQFPGTKIVKIEKKTLGFEIELSDGVELKFDRLGTFKSMSMDD